MIDDHGWHARIDSANFSDQFNVFLWQRIHGGMIQVLQPDSSMRLFPEHEVTPDDVKPSFVLRYEQVQSIVDALAERGFVPKGRRFEKEIDIIRDHLTDMRRLVFKEEKQNEKI